MDLSNLIGVWSTAQDTARQLQIAQAQRQLAYAQMVNQMRDQQIQQATNLYKAGMPGSAVEQTFPMTGIQGLPEESPDIAIQRQTAQNKPLAAAMAALARMAPSMPGANAGMFVPYLQQMGVSLNPDDIAAMNAAKFQAPIAQGQALRNEGMETTQRLRNEGAMDRLNKQLPIQLFGHAAQASGATGQALDQIYNTYAPSVGQAAGMNIAPVTPPQGPPSLTPKEANKAAISAGNNTTALNIALDRNKTAEDIHNTISGNTQATLAQKQAQFAQMMRLKWADLSAQDQHNAAQIAKDYYGINAQTFRAQMSGQGTKLSPYYQQRIAIGKQELNSLLQQQNNPMVMSDPAKLAALQAQIAQKKGEILGYANSANQDFQQNGSGALDPRDYAGTPQGQLTPAPGTLPPPAMGQQFTQPGNIWQGSGMTPAPNPYQNGGGGNLVPFGPHRVSARLGAVLGNMPANIQQIIQQNESQGQGNAPDSKGTHLSGDAIDISTRHLSPAQIDTILQAAYQSGLRGAYRAPGALSPNSPPHIHLAYNGGTSNYARLPLQPMMLPTVNTNDLPPGFPTNIPISGGRIRGTAYPQWTPSRYGVNRRR